MKTLAEWNRRGAGVRPLRVTRTKSKVFAYSRDMFGQRVLRNVGWEWVWRVHCRICDQWFPPVGGRLPALDTAHAHLTVHHNRRRAS